MTQTHVHPTWNCMLKSSTSTTLKSRERSREGEWDSERGRPLIRPDRHVTLPVPLPDQNPEVHPSTQNQRSGKRKRSMSPTYPGLSGINCSESNCALSYAQRSNCFEPGQLTPNKLNQASLIHHDAPHSPIQSGLTSFKGRPLTSTMSSPASTPLPPIIVAPNWSGKSSSNSERRTHPSQSLPMEIGPLHSILPGMPICSHLPTELKNLKCISATYCNNSQLSANPNTLGSSLLTKPSGSECPNVGIYSYPTSTSLTTCKRCTSTTTVQPNQVAPQEVVSSAHLTNLLQKNETNPVETGIKEYAEEERTATTFTSAKYASRKGTPATSAHRERALRRVLDNRAKRPSWDRGLMWSDFDLGISRAALWTEDALPLPSVPLEEFQNVEAISTIFRNPHLFKIVTPINVSRFKSSINSPEPTLR